ncbi:bifunctional riboflavin kinase/FAD synthetase [Reichenbachiella versicolor]|uniref:bifunctional riboflavin kinase/FAD synthetase n=1 Tax=Reichenbachiella versicolor TaxID=1821036 RepID=UPI000D6E2DAD|nr:bifunctional riboflavin kinase/FAD synthetase [Reichenbachiella versicolor]
MKIIYGIEDIPSIEGAVVTSGTFDGVHFGHQKILRQVVEHAKKSNGKSVVLTFWPHPRFVLSDGKSDLKLLSTFDEKAQLLEQVGIDYLIQINFTKEFSQLSSEEFIQGILVDKIGTKELVIGYDHRFGKNRTGGFDYLKENSGNYGFNVEEIKRQDIDHVGVSSTKVREALLFGAVDHANHYLGRNYSLTGKVVEGQKVGKSIGFPTANIEIKETYKLVPKDGVYAVNVEVAGQVWEGMLNIGERPTIEGAGRSIEVNIFDMDQDIYNEEIKVSFIKRIRDEKKFEGVELLKAQLKDDLDSAKEILKNQKKREGEKIKN